MSNVLSKPFQSAPVPRAVGRPSKRSVCRTVEHVTAPLALIAQRSTSLIARDPGRFERAGQSQGLPRFIYLGPQGGSEPLRIAIFAGIHGDESAGPYGLVRFVRLLEEQPEIARGYCLFLYPVCNPTGFEDDTRHSRAGKDLNREFWRSSAEPEIRILEEELRATPFDGIISLHADDTCDGVYGYAHGALHTRDLLRPALDAAGEFLPLDRRNLIDGFAAEQGIIRDSFEGVLRAPPGASPRPFEVILETPHQAPQYLQEAAFAVALRTILGEYRKFIAYAQNL